MGVAIGILGVMAPEKSILIISPLAGFAEIWSPCKAPPQGGSEDSWYWLVSFLPPLSPAAFPPQVRAGV